MDRCTRRTALKLTGGGLALSTVGTAVATQSEVETVVEIPDEERVPENLAFDGEGSLYFGITAGEVWRVSAEQTGESGLTLDDVSQIATLPGSAIGVEVGPDGSVFVASQAEAGTGVWHVPRNGDDPSPFAVIPADEGQDEVFPNDVVSDADRERLLVTESFGGLVYEVPLDAADPQTAASVWLDADALDTESFGANGLAIDSSGDVFVAVTRATDDAGDDVGRLVRVPIADDGAAADLEIFYQGPDVFGADGITTRDGDVYVAANSLNEVVSVTAAGETTTIASADDGLVFPSDVVFGATAERRNDLFICNFANETPTEGAIFRTDVPSE